MKFQVGDLIQVKCAKTLKGEVTGAIPSAQGDVTFYEIEMPPNSGKFINRVVAEAHRKWELDMAAMTRGQAQMIPPGANVLTSKPSFGTLWPTNWVWGVSPDQDVELAQVKKETEEFFCAIERKSLCDCGGHKLGYPDDQLHGHAKWCTLTENAVTILTTHGD